MRSAMESGSDVRDLLARSSIISRKVEWPHWHPPLEMIERRPYLPRFMAGGPGIPLGQAPETMGKRSHLGAFGSSMTT